MYMKNVMYKIIMGCYIVAALVLVTACKENLDIHKAYHMVTFKNDKNLIWMAGKRLQ